jgi:hypothetical protein
LATTFACALRRRRPRSWHPRSSGRWPDDDSRYGAGFECEFRPAIPTCGAGYAGWHSRYRRSLTAIRMLAISTSLRAQRLVGQDPLARRHRHVALRQERGKFTWLPAGVVSVSCRNSLICWNRLEAHGNRMSAGTIRGSSTRGADSR